MKDLKLRKAIVDAAIERLTDAISNEDVDKMFKAYKILNDNDDDINQFFWDDLKEELDKWNKLSDQFLNYLDDNYEFIQEQS